jgi:NAD+ kinase
VKVLLVPSANPKTVESARYLRSRLIIAGIDTEVQDPEKDDDPVVAVEELALVVPMGGDGTFLHAARLIGFASVPLLAFNYGTLGFLAGNPERDEVELIADALSGDVVFERRSTLDAEVFDGEGAAHPVTGLNEIVFARGGSGRVVEFTYGINGTKIAHLKADGLVISTATGSTGYALSAGGPIVSPGYKGLVVVPVAPHALNTRAIVTGTSDVVEVDIKAASPGEPAETSVFVDGMDLGVHDASRIVARRGEHELFFALGGGDFFTNVSRVFFGGPVNGGADTEEAI